VVIRGLITEADVTKRVLYNGFQDIRRLHANLLRKAAVVCCRIRRLHVELVDNNFKDIELLDHQIV